MFATEFPDATEEWHRESNYIVVLQVPDLPELYRQFDRLPAHVKQCIVIEPDLDDQPTAFAALGPEVGRILSSLPLAGKAVAMA